MKSHTKTGKHRHRSGELSYVKTAFDWGSAPGETGQQNKLEPNAKPSKGGCFCPFFCLTMHPANSGSISVITAQVVPTYNSHRCYSSSASCRCRLYMSIRLDPWGSGAVEIATWQVNPPGRVGLAQAHPPTKPPATRTQPSAGLGPASIHPTHSGVGSLRALIWLRTRQHQLSWSWC